MTVIRRIILAPLVVMLFVVLTLFQANLSVRDTIMSADYISDYSSEVNLGEKITKFGLQKLEEDSSTADRVNLIKGSIDQQWLAEQVNLFLIGTHGYFVNDSDRLPVLDISPAKQIIKDLYVSQMIANLGGEATKRELEMAEAMIDEQLQLDSVKNELDLHDIATKIYPQDASPINELRSIVDWYKSDLFFLNIMVIILLILTISMLTRNKKNSGFLISVIFFLSGLTVIFLGKAAAANKDFFINIKGNTDIIYFKDIFTDFISEIISTFTVGGVVYLIIGAVILGVSYIVYKKQSSVKESSTPRYYGYMKAFTVLISLAVITGGILYTADDVHTRAESLTTVMQSSSGSLNIQNILKVISESLDAEFLNHL